MPHDPPEQDLGGSSGAGASHLTRGIRALVGRLSSRKPLGIMLLAFLAGYAILWSAISLARMYAFQTQVYDLGIEMALFWVPYHSASMWSPVFYLNYTLGNGVAFLFWPFAIAPNYPVLLVTQSVLIGAPALVLYGIGRQRLENSGLAFLLAASYLFNFDIAGMNWYDFHLEAIFPLLFVLGYYLLLRGHYAPAGAVLFLSGLVRVPYMVFPLMLAVVLLVQHFMHREDWVPLRTPAQIRFASGLLLACSLYFVVLWTTGLFLTGGGAGAAALVHQGSFFTDFNLKLLTFGLLALPFILLLPLVRWWFLFFLPYAYLVFFVGWFHYYFPVVFTDQYLAIVVPFIYLGAIDAVRTLEHVTKAPKGSPSPPASQHRWRTLGVPYHHLGRRAPLVSVLSVLVILALLGLYLLPYGPFNDRSPVDFAFTESTTYNSSMYGAYLHMISLVPASDGYVVIQQNLPQLLPRPLPYSQPMSPPISPFGTNYTPDHYPVFDALTGTWANATIDYVVGEPQATQYFAWGNPSIQVISQQLYGGNFVGLVAEVSGMYVLERGYHGGLQDYLPAAQRLSTTAPEFGVGADGVRSADGSIQGPVNGSTTNEIWNLGYPFLVPGTYRMSFEMKTSSLDPGNRLLIGNPLGANWYVDSADFPQANLWTSISLEFNVTSFMSVNAWVGYCIQWNGSVSLSEMSIQEIAPPA